MLLALFTGVVTRLTAADVDVVVVVDVDRNISISIPACARLLLDVLIERRPRVKPAAEGDADAEMDGVVEVEMGVEAKWHMTYVTNENAN